MSFSLKIQNGDIAISGTSLATVEGANKLQQDLACAILTPMGSEENNPEYGSTIDGGEINGEYIEGVIGSSNWEAVISEVQAEIQKICNNYQRQQIARNERDIATYGKTTLIPGELLVSVAGIQCLQVEGNLLVKITLQTGNETTTLTLPIANEVGEIG